MNEYQQELYRGLLELNAAERKVFNFDDCCVEGVRYRIFRHHRIPDYTKWLVNKFALECRGIVFEMNSNNDEPVRLASFPFEKFFTLNENPLATNLDLSKPMEILVKEDGSLISAMYLPSDRLHLRSKNTLTNQKAMEANELIRTPRYKALHDWTLDWAKRGFTVIFEYTSPTNRIVVPYSQPALTVLAIRNHVDGSYVDVFGMDLPLEIRENVVKNLAIDDGVHLETNNLIEHTKRQPNMEGYVVRLSSGQRVKLKTEWYNSRHVHRMCPGNELSDLGLARAVLDDLVDDVRAMNCGDPENLRRIDEISTVVSRLYNDTVSSTTAFHKQNGHLDRRGYAVLAKKELSGFQMRLAVQLFEGKCVEYPEAIFSHLKQKGVMQKVLMK